MMDEDQLRAIVRDTIARVALRGGEPLVSERPQLLHFASHPSSYQYNLPPSGGPCFIEPGVTCNHCGFCQTHGH
jgi:hypothetical protein